MTVYTSFSGRFMLRTVVKNSRDSKSLDDAAATLDWRGLGVSGPLCEPLNLLTWTPNWLVLFL